MVLTFVTCEELSSPEILPVRSVLDGVLEILHLTGKVLQSGKGIIERGYIAVAPFCDIGRKIDSGGKTFQMRSDFG